MELDSAMRLDSGLLVAHGEDGMDSGVRGKEALVPRSGLVGSGPWIPCFPALVMILNEVKTV